MKTICKKTIVISIILLLIGVSVSSAISVDTKLTISNNEIEECRECQEVSISDLIRVERLLNRVEVYSNLLLVLSKFNPEIKEKCEEILYVINSNRQLDNSIICDILELIYIPLEFIISSMKNMLTYLDSIFEHNPIIQDILLKMVVILLSASGIALAYYTIVNMGENLNCDWVPPQ